MAFHRFVSLFLGTFFCALIAVGAPVGPTHAADRTIVLAQSTISEKEAYEAAKELGTIEAWEAFLNNFPKGFRADLARAYLKRIGSQSTAPPAQAAPPQQVAQPPAPPVPQPIAPPLATPLLDPHTMTLVLQNELKRVGCDPGKVDGKWGGKGRAALARFNVYAKLKLSTGTPTMDTLEAVKGTKERVCPLVCGPQFNKKGDQCVKKTCRAGQRLTSRGQCVSVTAKSGKKSTSSKSTKKKSSSGGSTGIPTPDLGQGEDLTGRHD